MLVGHGSSGKYIGKTREKFRPSQRWQAAILPGQAGPGRMDMLRRMASHRGSGM
jgi:hypothetical protein